MNLREAGVSEQCAFLMSAPDSRGVTRLGVRRKIEGIAVAARRENDSIRRIRFDSSVNEVAGNDTPRLSIYNNKIQHFAARIQLHSPEFDLATQGRICTEEKLLSGLSTGIECPGQLGAAEGTVVQVSCIVPSEGNALRDALVDDGSADFSKTIDISFPRSII